MPKTENQTVPALPAAMASKKTVAELAAEQGVTLPQNLQALVGQGHDLWESDAEFEEFLRWLNDAKRKGA